MAEGLSMKYALLVWVLFGAAAIADEAPPAVRVFVMTGAGEPGFHTGSVVKPMDGTLLYTKEACRLPIDGASKMLRYYNSIMGKAGCWYPTLDGGFQYILSNGYEYHSSVSWEMFARGVLNADGTVRITEPNFDSATFSVKVNERNYARATQRDPD
jgi:hypothetical protein